MHYAVSLVQLKISRDRYNLNWISWNNFIGDKSFNNEGYDKGKRIRKASRVSYSL